MDSGRLADRVALVTGAANGIGRAIVTELALDGARVVVSDIDFDAARAVAESVDGSLPIRLDVTSADSAGQAVEQIERDFGEIEILANNAGVSTMAPLWELTEREWDFNFDVNAKGVFIVTRAVIPGMMKRGRGAIGIPHRCAGKRACLCLRTMRRRNGPVSDHEIMCPRARSAWRPRQLRLPRIRGNPRCRNASSSGKPKRVG